MSTNIINPAFICPITQCEMTEPVIAPDGFTYEKSAIQSWFAAGHVDSPLTRERWNSTNLIPNRALKELIEASHNEQVSINLPTPIVQETPPPIDMIIKKIKDTNKYHISLKTIDKPEATMSTLFIDVLDISGSMGQPAEEKVQSEGGNYSRCDLVKHSVATQIELLREKDELALVLFDHTSTVVLQPTRMTKDGKTKAKGSLQRITPTGGTNIWGGLYQALKIAKEQNGKNIVIILQTDGESQEQYSPPTGIADALREWKEDNAEVRFSLHTVGLSYGSSLDMPLLLKLAYIGNGTVNYMPDGSMVGTVLIHLMSNLMACIYRGVYLRMSSNVTPSFLNVGFIQGGQSRDYIVESSNSEPITVNLMTDNLTDSQTKTSSGECTIEEVSFPLARDTFLKVLQKALYDKENHKNVDAELTSLIDYIKLTSVNSLLTDLSDPHPYKGQIVKGFQAGNFERWGRHFIPSVISAHRNQWGNNFKDESSKFYGGTTVKALIKQGNKLFIELPAPVPSIKAQQQYVYQPAPQQAPQTMAASLNASGGCFLGDSLIRMENGDYVPAYQIEKYDKVFGGAMVICVLKIYENKPIDIVTLGRDKRCRITPYHPVIIPFSDWKFPITVGTAEKIMVNAVYNFVLDRNHTLDVDGIKACTLNHDFTGPIISHPYFGNGPKNIMNDLISSEGWIDGYVEWRNVRVIRDSNTGLISKMLHD